MAGLKPNNFNNITPTGTTELYTQTGGVNGKFTVDELLAYISANIPSELTETVTYITATEVSTLGSTAKNSALVLSGSNYLSGEYEVVYQSTNNAWNIDPNNDGNQSIVLVAHLSSTYLGDIFDGVLFRADLTLMAAPFKGVAQGTFTNLFPITGYLPIVLPQFNGTVKFTMLDQNGNVIDIDDQGEVCGGLKIIMRTRVQSYS